MDGMGKRDTVKWAQEECLSGIDRRLREIKNQVHGSSEGTGVGGIPMDDEVVLMKVRNRVAKMFNQPVHTWIDDTPQPTE